MEIIAELHNPTILPLGTGDLLCFKFCLDVVANSKLLIVLLP